MSDLIAGAVGGLAKAVQSVVKLFSQNKKKMLTISAGEVERTLRMRDGFDRRVNGDRRQSPIDMRLRVGLWYQYHRVTRAGEFDPLPRDPYRQAKFAGALLPEMDKYEFLSRGDHSGIEASCALASAVDFLWAHPELGCNPSGESAAAYAVNQIADYLVATFDVRVVDRRKADRRAAKGQAAS